MTSEITIEASERLPSGTKDDNEPIAILSGVSSTVTQISDEMQRQVCSESHAYRKRRERQFSFVPPADD